MVGRWYTGLSRRGVLSFWGRREEKKKGAAGDNVERPLWWCRGPPGATREPEPVLDRRSLWPGLSSSHVSRVWSIPPPRAGSPRPTTWSHSPRSRSQGSRRTAILRSTSRRPRCRRGLPSRPRTSSLRRSNCGPTRRPGSSCTAMLCNGPQLHTNPYTRRLTCSAYQ